MRLSCRSLQRSGRGPSPAHHQIDAGHEARIIAGKNNAALATSSGRQAAAHWCPPMRAIQHSGIDRTAGGAGLDLAWCHSVQTMPWAA